MDLHLGRWIRDFVLLGTGIGLLAPSVMLGPMAWKGNPELLLLLLLTGFGGAAMGALVGTVLLVLTAAVRRPVPLAFAGVPVGALAGLGVGFVVGGSIDPLQMAPVVGTLGFLVGGPVLGLTWLPYLALKHVGRSGLPAIGTACIAGTAMVFEWLSSHGYL
jgi:hypothetical protein